MATPMTSDSTSPARMENVGGGATLPIAQSDVTGLPAAVTSIEAELLDHEGRITTLEGAGGSSSSTISDVSVKFAGPFRDENGGKWTFAQALAFLEIVTSTPGASPITDSTGHIVGSANRVYRLSLQLIGGDWTQDTGTSGTPGAEILIPIDVSLGIPIDGFLGGMGLYQDAGHAIENCLVVVPSPAEPLTLFFSKFDLGTFGITGHSSIVAAPLVQWYEKG